MYTVLIVDDDNSILELVTFIIKERQGIKVLSSKSGKDCLDIVEKTPVDLILLDLLMPDMNGDEVCRIIKNKKEFENIPVIFLTSSDKSEDVIKAFEVGAVDYITKPFNRLELLKRVCTHLDLKKSKDRILKINNELKKEVKKRHSMNAKLEHYNVELEFKNKQLLKINKFKKEVMSVLTHDIKIPLTVIMGSIELLLMKNINIDDKTKMYLNKMLRSSNKMNRLLNNILRYSKLDSDDYNMSRKLEDFKTVIENTLSDFEMLLEKNKIKLVFECPEILDRIYFDDAWTEQVISNLMSNAIKFTPENGTIKVFVQDLKDCVKCTVMDTGIGIEEHDQKNVFNKYQQVNKANMGRGVGLGLSICKKVIDEHKGELFLESIPGKGTSITFSLPKDLRHKPRIFIVDDNKEFADSLSDYLSEKYNIDVAYTGFSAGWGIKSFKPDIVLLDINLPDTDGYQVIKIVKNESENRNLIIIAVTGSDETEKNILENGFDYVIKKPIDNINIIPELIDNAMENKMKKN